MSKIEDNNQTDHSGYKKMYDLINDEINQKNKDDLKDIDITKSMNQINLAKSNIYIQIKHEDQNSKNNESIHITKLKIQNISSSELRKTQNQPNYKNKLIEEEEKNNDEIPINNSTRILNKKKEYKGTKENEIIYNPISDYKIQPIIADSKYNYFFILVIRQKLMDSIKISIYEKISLYTEEMNIQSYYILYQSYFISETKGNKLNEDLNYILVQTPVRKDTTKLKIRVEMNEIQYPGEIYNKTQENNYFHPNNALYAFKDYALTKDQIFETYLNFFFDEKNTNDEKLKSDLILSLIEYINSIYSYIELRGEVILRFLNYCFLYEYEPNNLSFIKDMKSPNPINKEIYLKY